MPTPFYHLSIASEIANHQQLNPGIMRLIQENLGAFYLGNTAPDVQVLSGQKRSVTHFFHVPIAPYAKVPWESIFTAYPGIREAEFLSDTEAVFVSGYLCHLQADWIWVSEIFEPVFGIRQKWATFSQRLYWHNILRAYLDLEVLADLNVGKILEYGSIELQNWLPFIQDRDLASWWYFLCEQLEPGKPIKTIDVFAARQGIDVLEFQSMLESEDILAENIFVHISMEQLNGYRRRLVDSNLGILMEYLGPRIAQK